MKMKQAIIKLLLKQPFYGSLALGISIIENNGIEKNDMRYTPFPILDYNREWFENLPEAKALGSLIHELMHMALLHVLRRGSRDILLWNAAADMAVNEYLTEAMLEQGALTVEKVSKATKQDILRMGSAEYYYDILEKLEDNVSIQDNGSSISLKIFSENEMSVKKQSEQEVELGETGKKALISMMQSAIKQAGKQGEIDGSLKIQLDRAYSENEVDWKAVFKRFLIGRGRLDNRKSYKKESRRYQDFPGNKKSIGLKCLLAIDQSGSIQDNQVLAFYNELMEINKITAAQIYVTEFDTTCTTPILLQNYVKQQKRMKNGGTDFEPIFQLADNMKIEFVVVFTDGDGTAPPSVNQKVLWVLTEGGKNPAEYGAEARIK